MSSSIGDVMKQGQEKALRSLAIGAGIVVYLGMLLYSGVHNLALMTRGISPEMQIWAILGVVALEISAAALPLALHYWTHAPGQRMAAFAFYGIDLALILANVTLDFALTAQETLPTWLSFYLFYVVPTTPIIAGLGWSILLLLDPAQKQRATIESLKAGTMEVLANKIADAARAADVNQAVDQAAGEMARTIITNTLGVSVQRLPPAPQVTITRPDQDEDERKKRVLSHPKLTQQTVTYNQEEALPAPFENGNHKREQSQ
jgi:hypothetical protein